MNQSLYTGLVAGGLVLAVALTAVPTPRAYAQTTDDLQAQITALLAQIALLQAQVNANSGSAVCPYTWNRTLTIGSTGTDVLKLQQFLNSHADTRVALSGVGSAGMETNYYGALTGAAVAKFQTKYRSDILTPLGLTSATTFFGNSTKAKLNGICVSAPTIPTTPTTPTSPTTPSTGSGNEVSMSNFKTQSGEDTNLEEGQKDVEIMDVEFKIKDSDITINRVDVAFDHVSGDEDDPWKTFTEVALYVDGKEVASKSVTNKRDWTENTPQSGDFRVRFSGLDIEFDEADDVAFSVGVSVANSIDGAEDGLSWDVFIPTDGIRLTDESKVTESIGDTAQTVNIDINEEGEGDELTVRSSEDDPQATTLALQSSKTSGWMNVFAFDLDTDDSENDIEINELPISLTVSSGNVSTYLKEVRLKIDGDYYDDVTIVDGTTNTMTFEFDSNEFVIDAGDRVTVEVEVKFKGLASSNEGVTIYGSVNADDIEAEGADDLTASQLSGAATGDTHTLRSSGLMTTIKDTDSKTTGSNNTVGQYEIEFSVTAFEGDFYIAQTADSASSTTSGALYTITAPSTYAGTKSAILSSTANEVSGGVYHIREGRTETFTLDVTLDPTAAGQHRVALTKLFYSSNTDGVTNAQSLTLSPASSYRTGFEFINN